MSRLKKIGLALIIMTAIAGSATLWYVMTNQFRFDETAEDGTLEGLTQEQLQAELDKKVEKSMFAISISSTPQFDRQTQKGVVNIENSPKNNYIMVVEITRDDNSEVIYRSKGIKPGQMIKEAELSRDLEPGNYPCTATFTAVEEEKYSEVGKTAAKINVQVK